MKGRKIMWLFESLVTNQSSINNIKPKIDFYHHQCFLPKGRCFTANAGTKFAVLSRGRSSTANSGTKVAVLLWTNRCCSFPLLSALHSLFSIWTEHKRSEKIPGAPTWRWGEWIWLTGPSRLHQNSPQGLNISSIKVFDQIRDPEIPITQRLTLVSLKHEFYNSTYLTLGSSTETTRQASASCLFGAKCLAFGPEKASWKSAVICWANSKWIWWTCTN